jgi:hypothetical protein
MRRRRPNAMSAAASVSKPGVFVATTARSRHAARSMLSLPTATFATTLSWEEPAR